MSILRDSPKTLNYPNDGVRSLNFACVIFNMNDHTYIKPISKRIDNVFISASAQPIHLQLREIFTLEFNDVQVKFVHTHSPRNGHLEYKHKGPIKLREGKTAFIFQWIIGFVVAMIVVMIRLKRWLTLKVSMETCVYWSNIKDYQDSQVIL